MLIRTTANIDISIEERIFEAAKFCGIKPHQIALVLLKIMIKNIVKYMVQRIPGV